MQKKELSPTTSTNTPQQRDWLELAECAALGVSALGSIVAAFSQQVFLAAAPLTIALLLNFVNRSRIPQQAGAAALPAAKKNTSNFDASIEDEFFPFPPPPNLFDSPEMHGEIAEIRRSVQSLQESTAAAVVEVRQYLAQQLQALSPAAPADLSPIYQALSEVRFVTQRLENTALTEQDREEINVQLLLLREAIAELKNTTADLQQRGYDGSNSSHLPAVPAPPAAEDQPLIADLHRRVEQLEQKNQEIVKPHLQRLIKEVKRLKEEREQKAGHL
ncbi:hypothetical protein [Kamptonema formosum]|uniref:hypothetical protein n=1 Tax=Kamptonema formosum TaxID=331992 RepID=UPI000347EDA6|nr:hypothetical protein [Oscillatoria sp. PCC 10802]